MHIFQAATMHSIFSSGGFVKQNKKPVNPEILSKQKLVNHNILSKAQMRQKAKTISYIHKDHLGSYETITDSLGNIVEKLNYDPWGRRRNPFTWGFENITATLPFERGFTGHEHLDHFGLINMNGRTYDPYLGRMLQTDNYVQAAGYMQNYNRYSYALNNPLRYTDPDGEWVHLVVGAVIGGTINWATHGAEFTWKGLGYFGIGAAAGALGVGIGAGVGGLMSGAGSFSFMVGSSVAAGGGTVLGGAAVGAASGFAGGLLTGTGNSLLQGNNIGSSLRSGLESGAWGAAIGGVTGGISGGIRGYRSGLRGSDIFWDNPYATQEVSVQRTMMNGSGLKLSGRSRISSLSFSEKQYSQSIPSIKQNGNMACTETVISAADRSMGGSMSPSAIRALSGGGNPNADMLKTQVAFDAYSGETHNMSGHFGNNGNNAGDAIHNMTQNDARVMLKYSLAADKESYHMVNLVSVSRSIPNGYQFTIMNPSSGSYNTISSIDFADFFYFIFPN